LPAQGGHLGFKGQAGRARGEMGFEFLVGNGQALAVEAG